MVKMCIEHGITIISFKYCPYCGNKLYDITEEQFRKTFYMTKDEIRDFLLKTKEI